MTSAFTTRPAVDDRSANYSQLRLVHLHLHPAAIGGSEASLAASVQGLQIAGFCSMVVCASADGPGELPAAEQVIVRPEIFTPEPMPPFALRRLTNRLMATIAPLRPDVVHVRLGVRPELVRALARTWPTVYSAHVPVCPNGARFLYKSEEVCQRRVGLGCLTTGFGRCGCGHLADGTPVTPHAFARSLYTTKKRLAALNECHSVIASSRWQADQLARDGVSRHRLVVVHPPVAPCSRAKPDGTPVVLFVGRLVRFKGAAHLLWASSEIDVPHRVWIAGDGPERPRLEHLSEQLGIRDRITFWGSQSTDEVRDMIGAASVMVMPSLVGETFGQVGAQAAAGGCPVIAYDVGGVRDWADCYAHVTLVAPRDWRKIAREVTHRLIDGTSVASVHNQFDTARHIAKLMRIYSSAAGCVELKRSSPGPGEADG